MFQIVVAALWGIVLVSSAPLEDEVLPFSSSQRLLTDVPEGALPLPGPAHSPANLSGDSKAVFPNFGDKSSTSLLKSKPAVPDLGPGFFNAAVPVTEAPASRAASTTLAPASSPTPASSPAPTATGTTASTVAPDVHHKEDDQVPELTEEQEESFEDPDLGYNVPVCKNVTVNKTEMVDVEECRVEQVDECKTVLVKVEPVCHTECVNVTKEVEHCEDVSSNECKDEKEMQCHTETVPEVSRVPVEECREQTVSVCANASRQVCQEKPAPPVDPICEDVEVQQPPECHNITMNKCEEKVEPVCNPIQVPVTVDVEVDQCHEEEEAGPQSCMEVEVEKCREVPSKECHQVWVQQPTFKVQVTEKCVPKTKCRLVWEEKCLDKFNSYKKPKCHKVKRKVCRNEPECWQEQHTVQENETVSQEVCDEVWLNECHLEPETHCRNTTQTKTVCTKVPEQRTELVDKLECKDISTTICIPVEEEKCVTRTTTSTVCHTPDPAPPVTECRDEQFVNCQDKPETVCRTTFTDKVTSVEVEKCEEVTVPVCVPVTRKQCEKRPEVTSKCEPHCTQPAPKEQEECVKTDLNKCYTVQKLQVVGQETNLECS